jgi:hypothetical protein
VWRKGSVLTLAKAKATQMAKATTSKVRKRNPPNTVVTFLITVKID